MNPRFGPQRRGPGGPGGPEHAKYLADALGITVEQLHAAQQAAAQAAMAAGTAEGSVPQEAADDMAAHRALQQYIAEKGLFKAAVESAVKDGVITQTQADQILSRPGPGMMGGGPGGPGRPGAAWGQRPGGPPRRRRG